MEEIDLRSLLDYFKKSLAYFILIVAATVFAGSIYTFYLQKPEYKSRATVILSSDRSNSATITQNEVLINKNLVDTYTEVVKSHRVLDKVLKQLDLDLDYAKLSKKIEVTAPKETEIIEINAVDANPELAKNIANATSEIFVKEISDLYSVKNVNVLDPALQPTTPYNVNVIRQELIALVAGIILASATIFLKFYFDRSVKTAEQIEQYIKLPLVAKIRKYEITKPKLDQKTASKRDIAKSKTSELIIKSEPKSRISEDFRTLRANLHFSLDGKKVKTVLLTSTSPSEGKSFITANLATTFAQSGKKVLLIDADMRYGRQHEIFNLNNEKGLSNLLADHASAKHLDYTQSTKIPNLSVITRGIVPPNPSELLDSSDVDSLLTKVRSKYDYILLDGTPVDELSDALIVAKKAERVILVCGSGDVSIEDLTDTKKSLENIDTHIAGVILNKMPEKRRKNKYNKYYL